MINNITKHLLNSSKLYPEKVAVIVGDDEIRYVELATASMSLARQFISEGVCRGDRIVLAMKNSIELIVAFWAALFCDAVVSVIDPRQRIEKLDYMIRDCDARLVVSDANLRFDTDIQCISTNTITNSIANPDTRVSIKTNNIDIDLALIIYTSGSTGEPKGVMMTHRNVITALESITEYLGNTASDVVISALPMSFDYGLYQMLLMTSVGGTLLLEPDFILPSRFLKLIELYRPTALPVVPSMVPLLKKYSELKSYRLESIRYVTNTGAALLSKNIELIKELFPQAKLFSMYGLTECKRCTYLPPEDIDRKPGSIGIPIPNTEMWIADENGKRLPDGEVGQMIVRGQTVMKGYWNKMDETHVKLRPGNLLGEYHLHTGDYGKKDEEGYFYYVDRMDEVIKSRGIKVSPKSIETQLMLHADVIEAVALGIDDDMLGQAILACVSTDKSKLTQSDIIQYCRNTLQYYEQPQEVILLNSLPKTLNGKIDKHLLREIYLNNKHKDVV